VPLAGERWSMTGFIAAMRAFDEAKYAGVLFLVGASFWVLEALWSLWTLKSVRLFFCFFVCFCSLCPTLRLNSTQTNKQ
jgi:hypothetical protein